MKILQFILLMLLSLMAFGQELPPIEKFTAENYKGDNQNWMISQGPDNYIYIANNKGLLEYNGSGWLTYASPNNTIVRAVKVIGEKIYTGCYAEFGYWLKNEFGTLTYTSLTPKLNKELLKDEQVWNIIEYDEWVVFQSSTSIYFYNTQTKTFKTITSNHIIYKIFKIKNRIYYHVAEEGIFIVEDGKPKLFSDHKIFKTERVINITEKDETLTIITRSSGFFQFHNDEIKHWNITADPLLKEIDIFSSIQLEDGSFVVGTISDGIMHISKEGNFKYQITQKNGLTNNTVLSLFEAKDNNVWAGMDNGINCVNVKSPVKTFFDYEGVLGTVYNTQVFKNVLYIGSNQGLFYKNLKSSNESFKFIEGTAGQVWDLFNLNDEYLFCGHHLGTFLIDVNKATKISNELGAWSFKPIPKYQNLLLQGNYNGLFILEKVNGSWQVRNKVDGFNKSSRYFEIIDNNQVWVSHEYKGVFNLKLNDSLTKVIKIDKETTLPLGKNTSLIKYKNEILYTSEEGVFKYDEIERRFKRDSILSTAITKEDYISGKLVVDRYERLWVFSKNNISYIENDDVTNKPDIHKIPIPSKLRKGVVGYENISLINHTSYVLGTINGYITLDFNKIHKKADHLIHLNAVELRNIDDNLVRYPLELEGAFDYKHGLLMFKYSVPEYDKYLDVNYQYKLEGLSNKWSKWSESPQVTFENLSFGDYIFKVRAKVGSELSKNTVSYTFSVHRPWLLSNLALAFYLLILLTIIFITHKAYKLHYIRKFKQKHMENEQMIMQMKNEKLNQEIESKNRELAISTMSIIKKNKVLNKIKKEIKNNKHTDNNRAIKLIDSNLNDTEDWSFFEQAFNNADKDFLDKIKNAHPDLTPNDLRFCAYLRLNLSSKEIAPLLNISVKSVETKRYRLRKKLGLEHDSGLVNYILRF